MEFPILSSDGQERDTKITVYTTRPDTIFGATYLVVAPEHPLLSVLVSTTQRETVEEYTDIASRKSDLESTDLQKEETVVFTVNGEAIPIWVADYVLGSYGTGAIMAVTAHDTRDFESASKFDIPIRWVVDDKNISGFKKAYSGTVINSSNPTLWLDINGLSSKVAASEVIDWAEKTANGKKKAKTKDHLSGKPARRETSSMPQWAGSCWYYLRFMDPKNSEELVAKTKEMYWNQVDVYVAGAEHAVLHLLYSRFWHKIMKSGDSFVLKDDPNIYLIARSHKMSVHRFLGRTWRLVVGSPLSDGTFKDGTVVTDEDPTLEQLRPLHKCIAKADPAYLKESTSVLPVQINGKTRGTIQVEETCSEEDAFQLASQDEKLSKYLDGKSIKKRIFVPSKILNVILDRGNVKAAVR
ncbi:hypothetical protein C1H46_039691 [Malus baccata]|uniref:leucine--tRNA ligase n=1 Tax=Malus baccata TaxID=106549 RepID=A0A540KKR9_MALBA|nr:hypothetical protein C1H46_039691 [Malus baccata]